MYRFTNWIVKSKITKLIHTSL